MKINSARIKAAILAVLAMLAGMHGDSITALPSWLKGLIGVAGVLYGVLGISSTEAKTGVNKDGPASSAPPTGALVMACSLALGLAACPAGCPNPPPVVQKVAHCSVDAVKDHGFQLLPLVNGCLQGDENITDCLLSLVKPAVGITEDVIACVVHDQANDYAAAASENPSDKISARACDRGQQFLTERGWTVQP